MKAARESDPARRAAWLRAEIQRHERLYYALGKPEISDREFDRLMAELVALEAAQRLGESLGKRLTAIAELVQPL